MTHMNRPAAATYYSLVQTVSGVSLIARWHNDWPTEATCWTEIDREEWHPKQGDSMSYVSATWDALRRRNMHLLDARPVSQRPAKAA